MAATAASMGSMRKLLAVPAWAAQYAPIPCLLLQTYRGSVQANTIKAHLAPLAGPYPLQVGHVTAAPRPIRMEMQAPQAAL
jgi:hypothetical protein